MIRDIQSDDVDFYVTDELEKRLLIRDYHPIFKLEVSQFEELSEDEESSEEESEISNKVTVLTEPLISIDGDIITTYANIEQTITINVEDFGGIKYRKKNDTYIRLNPIKGYYNDGDFFSDYKYVVSILDNHREDNSLFIDNETYKQYILINNQLEEVTNIIPGNFVDNEFTPFFTRYDNEQYPKDLGITLEPSTTDQTDISDFTEAYYDSESDIKNTDILVVYENEIRLIIRDLNNQTTLHTAQFPHLVLGSIEYKCLFTTPGYYELEVILISEGVPLDDKSYIYRLNIIEEDEIIETININHLEEEDEEKPLYIKNKIGTRIINPQINQPTNLKCSLNSLKLNNDYILELLNSNRSNLLFTSPTNKEYQIYKFESHIVYNNPDDLNDTDTWFFINADFIDEYIELHILPTYVNAMDNVILLSDNDIIDYYLNETSTTNNEEGLIQKYIFEDDPTNEEDVVKEYRTETIDKNKFVIANVPICSEPKWFDMTNYIIDDSNYKISFDCYSSYYYKSIFYINGLQIYANDNCVYLEYNDLIDVIPYDLLCKGEHNIEFSIEDDRLALGIDEYIISTNIFDSISAPTELQIGFQQTKPNNIITEALAIDDIDSYTYITNLTYEKILDEDNTDVTIQKIQSSILEEPNQPIKFPLTSVRNLHSLEIDIIRQGINSTVIGVVDRTNPEPYNRLTLLDYSKHNENVNYHTPIQYKNDNDKIIFTGSSDKLALNIEGINFEEIKIIPDKIPRDANNKYDYPINDNQKNIIQTLKYFNDDLYSETYTQIGEQSNLSDPLRLFTNKQFYEQHWLTEEEANTEYYEVNLNG